jgi:hypothetical protein
VRTRLTTLADLSERDVGAWRDLSARALEPNPFAEPDFVLPAAGRLGAGGEALLTVEDGSDLTAETYRSHERATLVCRPDGSYFDGMRPHHRRELRRLRRRLGRLIGAPLTTRPATPEPAAPERAV